VQAALIFVDIHDNGFSISTKGNKMQEVDGDREPPVLRCVTLSAVCRLTIMGKD